MIRKQHPPDRRGTSRSAAKQRPKPRKSAMTEATTVKAKKPATSFETPKLEFPNFEMPKMEVPAAFR
jgi:hypothetical protein